MHEETSGRVAPKPGHVAYLLHRSPPRLRGCRVLWGESSGLCRVPGQLPGGLPVQRCRFLL